jgi:hypothetical protein
VSRIAPLTAAGRADLPPPCVSCVFWQHDLLASDERRKAAWCQVQERRHGAFGRILHEDGRFRGMIQYGPSAAFPRAARLPAGPPGRDAALLTCTFLAGGDPAGVCERLVLEALADLKGRGTRAVEAFALRHADEVALDERFRGHHTLFDRAFLEGLGFGPVRAQGQVSLMRISLGGLIAAPGVADRARRAVARALGADARPAPA